MESPVNPWWWVLAILWAPLGGIVAYLVVKGNNPAGAGRLLKVSLLVWVALFVLGVAVAILLPMLLM
jgi:zinc transporter ZupT